MRLLKCICLIIFVFSSGFVFSQDPNQISGKILNDATKGKFSGGYKDLKWGMSMKETVTTLLQISTDSDKVVRESCYVVEGDTEDNDNLQKHELIEKKDGPSVIQCSFFSNSLYRVRLYLSSDMSGLNVKEKIDSTLNTLNSKYGKPVIKKKTTPINISGGWHGSCDEVTYMWNDKYTRISTCFKKKKIYSSDPGHPNYSEPALQYLLTSVLYESLVISNFKKKEESKENNDQTLSDKL